MTNRASSTSASNRTQAGSRESQQGVDAGASLYFSPERNDFVFARNTQIPAEEFLQVVGERFAVEYGRSPAFHLVGSLKTLTNPGVTLNLSQARSVILLLSLALDDLHSRSESPEQVSPRMEAATKEALPIATYLNTCNG